MSIKTLDEAITASTQYGPHTGSNTYPQVVEGSIKVVKGEERETEFFVETTYLVDNGRSTRREGHRYWYPKSE